MIFVTVGTHEQPFNRLVECIDKLKKDGDIREEVIIQTGYSTYEPQHCKWQKLFPYQEMLKLVEEARIVITHVYPKFSVDFSWAMMTAKIICYCWKMRFRVQVWGFPLPPICAFSVPAFPEQFGNVLRRSHERRQRTASGTGMVWRKVRK